MAQTTPWNGSTTVNSTVIGFGGQQWVVIGNDAEGGVYSSNADNTSPSSTPAPENSITLLLKNGSAGGGYGLLNFNDNAAAANGYTNYYNGSTLQTALASIAAGWGKERNVINARDLVPITEDGGWLNGNIKTTTYLVEGDGVNGDTVAYDQLLWALSYPEYVKINSTEVRKYGDGYTQFAWWLRSPNGYDWGALAGQYNGGLVIFYMGDYDDFTFRPAFSLNLESGIFTSDSSTASSGKSGTTTGGGWVEALPTTSTAQKYTFLDSSIATPNLTLTGGASGLNFAFTGASTGTNMYVSGFLQGVTDHYYAKYADAATLAYGTFDAAGIGGTLTGVTPGTYFLHIFGEEANSYLYSDFASESVDFSLSVDGTGNASNFILLSDVAFGLDGGEIGLRNTLQYTPDGYTENLIIGAGGGTIRVAEDDAAEISGIVSGTGSLTKSGSGTLTLSGTNTYTGGTTISAGTLQIGNGDTTGSVTGNITNNAVLIFYRSDALAFSGVISGTGSLTQSGSDVLTLTGNNTYSGNTIISAGKLTVTGTLDSDANSGNGYNYAGAIANSGALTFAQSDAQTLSGNITGTGSLTQSGANVLTLTGINTYANTTIDAGTLSIDSDDNIGTGTNTLNGDTLLLTGSTYDKDWTLAGTGGTIDDNGGDVTMRGSILSSGTNTVLTKAGDGTLSLSGDFSGYLGSYSPNAGVLKLVKDDDLPFTLLFNNVLGTGTVDGTLAFDLVDFVVLADGSRDGLRLPINELTFGDDVGSAFKGMIDLTNAKLDLNDSNNTSGNNVETVLNAATLQLSLGAEAYLTGSPNEDTDVTIYGLRFNGGTLHLLAFDDDDRNPDNLFVNTLDVTGGGTVMIDFNEISGITIPEPGSDYYGLNFFDYAGDASIYQEYLVAADTVASGVGRQLKLIDFKENENDDGTSKKQVIRYIDGNSANDAVGAAIFDYVAVIESDGTPNDGIFDDGLRLGFGLKAIESYREKTVTLDSRSATTSPLLLNAQLTGEGNFMFIGSGTETASAGNADSDYSGTTIVDRLALTAIANKVFGNTSSLSLVNNASVDFRGNSQTVGALYGEAGTSLVLGSGSVLSVGDAVRDGSGTFAGVISGSGSLTKQGTGTLTLTADNTYTGPTLVNAGTLALFGSLASNVTVASDASFNLHGAADKNVTLDGGTLNVWPDSAIGGALSATGNTNAFLNFYLPSTINGTPILLTGSAALDNIVVGLDLVDGKAPLLQPDERIVLLNNSTVLTSKPVNNTVNMRDSTARYIFELEIVGNQLRAFLSKITALCEKPIPEGYLTGVALLNSGVDFADRIKLDTAHLAPGPQVFGTVGGGRIRYTTGAHFDMDATHLIAGSSSSVDLAQGRATAGVFFEHGEGDYDTRNCCAAGKIKGSGDSEYSGVGLLGRVEADNGTYAKATLRSGRVNTDFHSSEVEQGVITKYKSRAAYYGASLSLGRFLKLNDTTSIDIYGSMFLTHENGDKAKLSTGEQAKFSAIDSRRVKLGTRINGMIDAEKTLSAYAGVAYEHEFDGKAKARIDGYKIEAPKLKGDSGIVELGLTLNPANNKPLTFNFEVQSHSGKREGVTGSLRVNYKF
jgi:autotransporter-associated beta strand protein